MGIPITRKGNGCVYGSFYFTQPVNLILAQIEDDQRVVAESAMQKLQNWYETLNAQATKECNSIFRRPDEKITFTKTAAIHQAPPAQPVYAIQMPQPFLP